MKSMVGTVLMVVVVLSGAAVAMAANAGIITSRGVADALQQLSLTGYSPSGVSQ